MSKKIIELADKLKSKIYPDYNASKHTWFRTGGNAKIFAIVENHLELEIILNEINNEGEVVMYCKSGKRSKSMVYMLKKQYGLTHIQQLEGGYEAWCESN